MRILLVAPSANRLTDRLSTKYHFPPLGLAVLAAHTPAEFEVEIFDEAFQELDLEKHLEADLVGISTFTANVKRGYEIADFYRSHSISVVMGGHHVSALPDEALQHADAVVVGEGDLIWHTVLEDFKCNRMRGKYRSGTIYDLTKMPYARLDLFPAEANYLIRASIHVSRGCNHHCAFCSVPVFWGRFRKRPVDEVIAEMRHLKENFVDSTNRIVFHDDNPTLDKQYAKKLFRKMIPLGLKYQTFAGVDIAEDDELLRLMKDSGCMGAFLGFDAIRAADLDSVQKRVNRRFDYVAVVKKIQEEYGIPVIAGLVVGFDHETVEVFDEIRSFLTRCCAANLNFNILYAYPGTPLFEKLRDEDRITSYDWDNYVMDGVNFIPKGMTQNELHDGYMEILKWYSSDQEIAKRVQHALSTKMGEIGATMIQEWGRGMRRAYEECLRGEHKIRTKAADSG